MSIVAVVALTLTVAACATAPPPLPAFTPFSEPTVSLDQRAAQVRRAASGLGWTAMREAPGRVELQRGDGGDSAATVDFTERNFVVHPNEPAMDELRQSIVAQSGF